MRSVYAWEAGAANKSNAKGDCDSYILQWSDQNLKMLLVIYSRLFLSMYSDNSLSGPRTVMVDIEFICVRCE